jgi:hypothetical protein
VSVSEAVCQKGVRWGSGEGSTWGLCTGDPPARPEPSEGELSLPHPEQDPTTEAHGFWELSAADRAVRLVIAEELGHSRESVTTHYLGSLRGPVAGGGG